MDYTPSGIVRFGPADMMKPLDGNFTALADSVEQAMDNEIGLRKVVPTSSLGGSTDLLGSFTINQARKVIMDGMMDSDKYLGWRGVLDFNLIESNSSFRAKFRRYGAVYGGTGSYGWSRFKNFQPYDEAITDNGPGVPSTDHTDFFPISIAPGSDSVHTAFATIDILRASAGSAAHGFVNGGTNLNYSNLTKVDVVWAYNSTGRDFDGIEFELASGDPFSGTINFYGYN